MPVPESKKFLKILSDKELLHKLAQQALVIHDNYTDRRRALGLHATQQESFDESRLFALLDEVRQRPLPERQS
jgi:hypothetical protein